MNNNQFLCRPLQGDTDRSKVSSGTSTEAVDLRLRSRYRRVSDRGVDA